MGEDLKRILSGLRKVGQGKPLVVEAKPEPERPMAEALAEGLPEPTQFELDFGLREEAPKRKGVNPYLPYYSKGSVEVKNLSETDEPKLPPMEKVKLNNALAKAKLGKRLTLAERRTLGKHNLARIMVRFRPKGGDLG